MADNPKISQIKLPNGSTYDIEDNTSGYTSNTGTITSVKTTAGAHTTINVSSGAAEFNVPTKTSHLTNDSGFITGYTETDPVFTASPAHGITSTDISNWNAKVSDDKTWNGVTLNKSEAAGNDNYYLTGITDGTTTSTTARLIKATTTPEANRIPKYGVGAYLKSTTPSTDDNSTKVATTEFVKSVIPTVLEPLIGSTSEIIPAQVKTALQEGRDICIQKAGIFEGINLDLRFTSWNSATDTDYSGQVMDVVVSQTIARYGTDSDGEYYLFELVGIISNGQWALFNTILAQVTDIPTKTSDLTNDSGYITSASIPSATTTTPKMDGTASVGSETKWAKGDHVHPHDTSRVPTTRKVNGKALSADVILYAGDVAVSSSDDTTVASALSNKVDKVEGKGLSTNDFTDADKTKLDGIREGANVKGSIVTKTSSYPSDAILSLYDAATGEYSDFRVYSTQKMDTMFSGADAILYGKVDKISIGKANGVAPLDANSKIDAQYLPSYVDDVIEAYPRSGQTALSATWLATGSATGTVITPEAGKIYVLMADSGDYSENTQFRWGGITYIKLNDGGVSAITNAEIDTIVAS